MTALGPSNHNSNSELTEALASLPALIEPASISLWPPAPGWWLLLLLALLGTAFALTYRRYRRETAYLREALQTLRELQKPSQAIENTEHHQRLQRASELLRICSRVRFGQAAAVSASGPRWLAQLDRLVGQQNLLASTAGQPLLQIYSLETLSEQNYQSCLLCCEQWLHALKKTHRLVGRAKLPPIRVQEA